MTIPGQCYSVLNSNVFIHWIATYPFYKIIRSLNSWGQATVYKWKLNYIIVEEGSDVLKFSMMEAETGGLL